MTAPGSQVTSASRAFVFADLVGFTALTEERGDDAAADTALAFCDEVCDLNRGHGAEDVKTIGDACMVLVDRPEPAVRLGLAIVDRVGPAHGFPRVRVGIDYGPATRRGDDWFGATVNTAARLVSIADESSVLVTDRLRRTAGAIDGVEFLELGPRELKGLSDPVVVCQAKAD